MKTVTLNKESEKYVDSFLQKRIVKYDKWLAGGQISSSSKVIPVSESFNAKQWVLPTEQVMEILTGADSVAVQDCECRTHYRRCDKPLEVCFLLNKVADTFVAKNMARYVSLDQVILILQKANENGLIHLALYMPDHEIFALCSCCSCCCHELQIVKLTKRKELLIHSEYIALTAFDICIHCGECVDRCFFKARTFLDEKMLYYPEACLGCGLCISVCPVNAITMVLRDDNHRE